MCGRYWLDDTPEIRELTEKMKDSPLLNRWRDSADIVISGEARPTNVVPVIAPDKNGQSMVYPMKWGFTGRSLLVNARSESAAEKPMFSEAWKRHRCIVPASGYFEWEHFTDKAGKKKTGDKFLIRPKGAAVTWLCGLYRIENGLPVFVILTGEPSEEIKFIHNRMPVIMPEHLIDEWVRPDADPDLLLPEAMRKMEFERAV